MKAYVIAICVLIYLKGFRILESTNYLPMCYEQQ